MLCFFLSDEELEEAVLRPGWKFSQLLQNWHGEETAKSSNTVTSVQRRIMLLPNRHWRRRELKKSVLVAKLAACLHMQRHASWIPPHVIYVWTDYGLSVHIYGHTPCVCAYICVCLAECSHLFMCNHVLSACSCCRVFVLQLKAEEGKFVSGDGEARAEAGLSDPSHEHLPYSCRIRIHAGGFW